MLTEALIASSSAAPTLTANTNASLKDAGIFFHVYQPQPALKSTFKKSVSDQHCLAINSSHIFAAQKQKAVIHVYNRAKGNQEATIPFPERICSVTLAATGTILVVGLEGGGILLWELTTGRLVTTPQAHLQAVNVVEVDITSNFLLSGSKDSTVLVWSLLDLLSFSQGNTFDDDGRKPRHTLSAHKSAITALATGHSAATTNIAVSTSKDQTAIIWNYQLGQMIRLFLLPAAPLCVALDPADRAAYTGYDDGSVQFIDFFAATSQSSLVSTHDLTLLSTPLQPPPTSRWTRPAALNTDAVLSIALSFDGTKILSGHQSGKILAWDISNGSIASNVADFTGAPITNLKLSGPEGHAGASSRQEKICRLMKPRQHEAFSGTDGGKLTASYTMATDVSDDQTSHLAETDFDHALESTGFGGTLLDESRAGLVRVNTTSVSNGTHEEYDYMALDDQSQPGLGEIEVLKARVAHLENLQHQSFDEIARLTQEKTILQEREKAADRRKVVELRRRQALAEEEWRES